MSGSWLTPSDIAEKLTSHISSGFVFPIKVRGTVILDRQRGYYRLSDGKAGITLNIPPSVNFAYYTLWVAWLGLLAAAEIILLLILWKIGK